MAVAINPIEGPFKEMPTVKPGTVVVATGPKGVISLKNGERLTWGERLFGGYNGFYLVDISPQIITRNYIVPSRQQTFMFDVTVTWTANVIDPAGVISRGIKDLGVLFDNQGANAVAMATGIHPIENAHGAKAEVNAELAALKIDPVVDVRSISVVLRPDAAAQEYLRKTDEETIRISALQSQQRYEATARVDARALLDDPEALFAQLLVTKDDVYRQALQHRLDRAASEQQRRTEIMKALIDAKFIEAHDFHARFPDFLNEVFSPIPALTSANAPNPSQARLVNPQQPQLATPLPPAASPPVKP